MRNRYSLFAAAFLLVSLFLLQDCKHDPVVTQQHGNDPDSLYVGRPYTFATIPALRYSYRSIAVPADNPMTYEGVQLGRMLFYDSTLSLNHQVSCGGCHKQQYAFGDNQKLSHNVLGSTVRNTPSLINLGMNEGIVSTKRYFWDGRQGSIEAAVDDAFNHEMRPDFTAAIAYLNSTPQYTYLFKKAFGRPGDVNVTNIEKAIAQFLRTLISVNSRIDQYYRGEIQLTAAEAAGLTSITASTLTGASPGTISDCFHCHTDDPYLDFVQEQIQFQNNGLDSVPLTDFTGFADLGYGGYTGNYRDNGKFKIPTLRNVAVSGPYMHDGRFATLEEVIGHYSDSLKLSPNIEIADLQFVDSGGVHLSATGKANLLAFLNAFTDTAFLHNPAFSNPFH